jgi:hypothetical protein
MQRSKSYLWDVETQQALKEQIMNERFIGDMSLDWVKAQRRHGMSYQAIAKFYGFNRDTLLRELTLYFPVSVIATPYDKPELKQRLGQYIKEIGRPYQSVAMPLLAADRRKLAWYVAHHVASICLGAVTAKADALRAKP